MNSKSTTTVKTVTKRQPNRRNNIAKKVLSHLFHWKIWYILAIVGLILLYPSSTSDGHWTYIRKYGIRLPLRYELHGIDVSHHNDIIDWKKVKKSQSTDVEISFCFIKATEGGNNKDEDFERNWKEAKNANLIRGAYHFYVPMTDPRKQAQNFIESVNLEKGDFVPVLDFENQGKNRRIRANLKENVATWLDIIEKHFGVKPIIYSNKYIYENYLKGNFDEYPLWISDYKSQKLEGYEDAKLLLWQHSTDGKVDGIRENVDFNVFVGTKKHLEEIRM